MFNDIFKIVYFIGFLIIVAIRKLYMGRYRKIELISDQKSTLDTAFLGLVGMGMLVSLVYVFSPILDFANYDLPNWLGWVGATLFGFASWLFWRSHTDLGRNWTPTLGIRAEHELITKGIYSYMRHPMYTAHLLWALSLVLLLHNWIAGYSFLIFMLPHYLWRVNKEEDMMVKQFGEEYRRYAQRTGRIFPRFLK